MPDARIARYTQALEFAEKQVLALAEKHLGYKPAVDFEEGLARTVAWYRSREVEPQLGRGMTGRD